MVSAPNVRAKRFGSFAEAIQTANGLKSGEGLTAGREICVPGAKPFDALAVMFGIGLIFLAPLYVWETANTPPVRYTPSILAVFLYCGLGASIFCYWLWAKAISFIGPARAAIVYYSMPLFCGVEAIVFLGEKVLWVHYISGAMILGGLLVATKPARK